MRILPGDAYELPSPLSSAETRARIEAETICVSGGAAVNGSAYLSPAPSEYCPAEPDPMTYLQS